MISLLRAPPPGDPFWWPGICSTKLSLGAILDAHRPTLRHGEPLSERIFPLLANRLTRPGSEHALAPWLEDFYVCNSRGRRWAPVWKQSRRVKVGFDQLKLWYRSLDDLLAEKQRIEKEVYLELRNLFSLQSDLAFYDITSTYFEGTGPAELGRFGYSRDGKPRNGCATWRGQMITPGGSPSSRQTGGCGGSTGAL